MKRNLILVSVFCFLCVPCTAETIFYLDFDDTSGGPFADWTTYTPGFSEGVDPDAAGIGTVTFAFRNNAGDGPAIGSATDGVSGIRQGGNVLLVDSCGGQDEGLQITAENGFARQDFTMEVVWYTLDAACAANTVGIQSMCGDEWPFGEISQFFIRTVGADRFDYWTDRGDSDNENVQITGTGVTQAMTWYHDVIVFDFNDATPANSSLEAYRNGVSQGTSPYDASAASVSLFGGALAGNRTFAIGFQNSLDANFGDHRGLNGAIDAFALSTGILGPGTFVLPEGIAPPLSSGVEAGWDDYR